MGLETLIGAAIAAVIAIFVAWFGGKRIGKADGAAETAKRDAERIVESNRQVADAQVKAANQSTEVRNEVSTLDDGAAAQRLRDKWSRPD